MNILLLDKILEELGLSYKDIAIHGNKNRPEILYHELISALIDGGSVKVASNILHISLCSLQNCMRRDIKNVLPTKPSQSSNWDIVLLSVINYRKCCTCNIPFPIVELKVNGTNSRCIDCESARYRNNSDRIKKYYVDNREFFLKRAREYYRNNIAICRARHAKYRAKVAQASTYDYGSEQELEILAIYENCPSGYHVDHIIPITHELVCGLHVPANLQYLTAEDNLRKSNKFEIM